MKKVIATIVLGLMTFSAFAQCQWPTRYQCYVAPNGKVVCGCM